MSTHQHQSIINTFCPSEIAETYPTLITHYEDVTHNGFIRFNPISTNYTLYVIYQADGIMVDIYSRKCDYKVRECYAFGCTVTLADAISNLDNKASMIYSILDLVQRKY